MPNLQTLVKFLKAAENEEVINMVNFYKKVNTSYAGAFDCAVYLDSIGAITLASEKIYKVNNELIKALIPKKNCVFYLAKLTQKKSQEIKTITENQQPGETSDPEEGQNPTVQ